MRKRAIITAILGIMMLHFVACGPSKHRRTYLRTFPVIGQLMNESVSTFCRDGHFMWIGYGYMGAGVTKYNIKTGWAKHFTNLHETNGIKCSLGGITGIAVTKKHVWLVGGEEVICLDKKDKIVRRFTDRNGLPSHKAFSVAATRIGVLVGYMGYGFSVINDETFGIKNYKIVKDMKKPDDYLNRFSPTSFVLKGNWLYMGGMEDGTVKYNLSDGKIHRMPSGSIEPIDIQSNNGEIWACEYGGESRGRVFYIKEEKLCEIKKIDQFFVRMEGIIGQMTQIGDQLVFATGKRYVYSWNRGTDHLKRIRLRNALFGYYYLEAFYFDGEYFWIGFQNGAQVIPKKLMLEMIEDEGETLHVDTANNSDDCGAVEKAEY